MSNQRLEGSDLEALLARVREEHGEEARIVEANRLRRGGVGGFFAKESFEVIVDLDAHLDRDGDGDDGDDDDLPPAAVRRAVLVDGPGDDRFDDTDGDDDREMFVPFTIDELASSIDDPTPSFAPAPPPRADAARRYADAGGWNSPDLDAAGDSATGTDDDGPAFAEVLGRAIAAERAAVLEPAWPATAAVQAAAPAARIVAPRLDPGGLSGVPTPGTSGLSGADLSALTRLGLPIDQAALVARSDDPAAVALVRLLERFPAAPALPRSAGAVIAVVGGRVEARELATVLAGRSVDVVTAAVRRGADLRTAAAVTDLRASWRRRRRPVVVAVEAPFDVTPSPWASDLLDALEPTLVLAHVDAGRKPEDVVAWSSAVGGIDALAVSGLQRTTTPAAILAAGIPVASLDGEPATPARWAALLTDRLTAALAA